MATVAPPGHSPLGMLAEGHSRALPVSFVSEMRCSLSPSLQQVRHEAVQMPAQRPKPLVRWAGGPTITPSLFGGWAQAWTLATTSHH